MTTPLTSLSSDPTVRNPSLLSIFSSFSKKGSRILQDNHQEEMKFLTSNTEEIPDAHRTSRPSSMKLLSSNEPKEKKVST